MINDPSYTPGGLEPEISFFALLYRFFFFDWLFADMTRAVTLLERQAAWRHNQSMRKYLPIYLRRWIFVATTAFLMGCLFERVLEDTLVAACWYTGFSVSVPVITVIAVVWLFLSRPNN